MKYLLPLTALLLSSALHAQGSFMPRNAERAGTWDWSLTATQQGSADIAGQNGAFVDFDSKTGFGFGLGYNVNNHLTLGGEMLFSKPRYNGRFVDENDVVYDISNRASVFTGQLKATWNFLPGNLTPYVEGSLGWTNVDSNVSDGPPTVGCWWDPWWGYICRDFYTTYNDSNFSYSVGVGGRWDVNRQFGMRAGYTRQRIDLGSSTSDPEFDVFRLDFVFRN